MTSGEVPFSFRASHLGLLHLRIKQPRRFRALDMRHQIPKPLVSPVAIKRLLPNLQIPPRLPRLSRDRRAPVADGGVLVRHFPIFPSLGLDNPVDLAIGPLLHDDKIWIVEADPAAAAQVIDTEARLPLAQGREPRSILGFGNEARKARFQIVVDGDGVEDRLVASEMFSPPDEWLSGR